MSTSKLYEDIPNNRHGKFNYDVSGALSKDQVQAFFTQGYIVLKHLFTKEEVKIIAKHSEQMFTEAQGIAEKYKVENKTVVNTAFRCDYDGLSGPKSASILAINNEDEPVAIKLISWAGGIAQNLIDLSRQDKIIIKVGQLLGSDKANHLINQIHYKMPHDKVTFNWHQDIQNRRTFDPNWEDVNKKGSFIQVLTAIDEVTTGSGPLIVIPYSHKEDLHLSDLSIAENKLKIKQKYDLATAVPLLLEPGDTIFMHPVLLHQSEANESDQPRKMFINGFSYPEANKKPYPGAGSTEEIFLNIPPDLIEETNDFIMESIKNIAITSKD